MRFPKQQVPKWDKMQSDPQRSQMKGCQQHLVFMQGKNCCSQSPGLGLENSVIDKDKDFNNSKSAIDIKKNF